jgi:hypothetical protein
MSLSVVNGPISNFNPYTRDQAPLWQQLAYAFLGVGSAAQRATAQAGVLQKADIKARVKTTDNTAASQAIDLTDRGVTFPAGAFRKIRWTSFATTDNDSWFQEWEQVVWGNDGTTPKLIGSPKLISAGGEIAGTAVHYGNCHAAANYDSSDTAITTTVGTSNVSQSSTAGSSIGNISTNTATLTHPRARVDSSANQVGTQIKGVNASSDVAAATEQLLATVYPINATTMSIYTADTATPSADGFDDDGRLEVEFFILPPPSAALVMNSNNVELHVGFDATDDVYHDLAVYVGAAETHAHVAD